MALTSSMKFVRAPNSLPLFLERLDLFYINGADTSIPKKRVQENSNFTLDPQKARSLMDFAAATYISSPDTETLNKFIAEQKAKGIDVYVIGKQAVPNQDYRGLIFRKENDVTIAFHGSNKLSDWLMDAEFSLRPSPLYFQGKVHDGFYKISCLVVLQIIEHLSKIGKDQSEQCKNKNIKYTGLNIHLCGHSLGGAISMVLAKILQSLHVSPTQIFTIAPPLCFDETAANSYNDSLGARTHNLVLDPDIVPASLIPFGYATAGNYVTTSSENIGKFTAEELTELYVEKFLEPKIIDVIEAEIKQEVSAAKKALKQFEQDHLRLSHVSVQPKGLFYTVLAGFYSFIVKLSPFKFKPAPPKYPPLPPSENPLARSILNLDDDNDSSSNDLDYDKMLPPHLLSTYITTAAQDPQFKPIDLKKTSAAQFFEKRFLFDLAEIIQKM